MFNLGNKWMLKEEAQKLNVEVFFRGIGGVQDTIMTLVKLKEAGIYIHQYVMVDGIKFRKDMPLMSNYHCSIDLEKTKLVANSHTLPECTLV